QPDNEERRGTDHGNELNDLNCETPTASFLGQITVQKSKNDGILEQTIIQFSSIPSILSIPLTTTQFSEPECSRIHSIAWNVRQHAQTNIPHLPNFQEF